MKLHFLAKILPSAAAIAVFSFGCATTGNNEFVDLFDGKSLNGWTLVNKNGSGYGVKDGVIYCARGGAEIFLRNANFPTSCCDSNSSSNPARTTASAFVRPRPAIPPTWAWNFRCSTITPHS